MPDFAVVTNGVPRLITEATLRVERRGGRDPKKVPVANLRYYDNADLEEIGVYRIVDDAVPNGKIASNPVLTLDGDVVRRSFTLTDAPVGPIPLHTFARRVKAEGLFDALSDHMVSTAARRRVWDEMRIIRDPIAADSAPARTILTAIGASQDQIDRIMAG